MLEKISLQWPSGYPTKLRIPHSESLLMAFFKSLFRAAPRYPKPALDWRLTGQRVMLRAGDPADWRNWRVLRESSRDFLIPWEPSWPSNALAYSYFCGLLRRHGREWRKGEGYNFHIFLVNDEGKEGALAGGISLNGIERGIAQTGTLGYWMGEPYTGQGYMREAAALVCDFAFETLRLHRLQASCLPHNEASVNLLRRLGFEEEGYAKAYLQINGKWEDHILWARVAPAFR
jgi:ribosomal-protein-alanine N-acetyltransferase